MKCPVCTIEHETVEQCPWIQEIEYYEDGVTVKRFKKFDPVPFFPSYPAPEPGYPISPFITYPLPTITCTL